MKVLSWPLKRIQILNGLANLDPAVAPLLAQARAAWAQHSDSANEPPLTCEELEDAEPSIDADMPSPPSEDTAPPAPKKTLSSYLE